MLLGLCTTMACVTRKYNVDAQEQTFFQSGKPRIAIDYVGFGWCHYTEDTSVKPEMIKTLLTEQDSDFNLDTGILTTQTFQLLYVVRKFKKAHPVSMDFEALSEYQRNHLDFSKLSDTEMSVVGILASEIGSAKNAVYSRSHEQGICENIRKDKAIPTFSRLKDSPPKYKSLTEYIVRCRGDSGEVMSRSEGEVLNTADYKLVSRILNDLTSKPEFSRFRREGANCKDDIVQLEIIRGPVIGTRSEKISN